MTESPFFTIIIPVYNVQKYLDICVYSVLEQDYDDYEILLIDDGSTDKSGDICDQLASKYPKIRAFHKENGGLSSARNYGIISAKGRFLIFLDSDDALSRGLLAMASAKILANNCEVLIIGRQDFVNNFELQSSTIAVGEHEQMFNGLDYFSQVITRKRYYPEAQCKIVNRHFLISNNLFFERGLYHEDELWTPVLLAKAKKVYECFCIKYLYRVDNLLSITNDESKRFKRAIDRLLISQKLNDFSLKNDVNASFMDNISAQYMYAVYSGQLYKENGIVNRFFPLKSARTLIYKIKSLLFAISPRLACKIRGLKEL